ncbi:hypothetical protein [Aquipuribacter nitratireducens]|uniref:Flagellar FliJ protein n=1 Tax=Aquipuribacter nitratireducens TaxID=650104 RepID=A0ABW0GRN8_9MICO
MSFAALLGLRRRERATAERSLATATAVRVRAEAARAEVVGRLHNDPFLLDSAGDPRLALARRAGLLADLSRAGDAVVASSTEEERERLLASQARVRLRAVERLEERRVAEERARRAAAEAAELDDVVASRRPAARTEVGS